MSGSSFLLVSLAWRSGFFFFPQSNFFSVYWRFKSQSTHKSFHRNATFPEKISLLQKNMREGLEHRKASKPQDMKYIHKPQICPGGSVCNYHVALSGNNFHAVFKISILVSFTRITSKSFLLLPSSFLLSLNSLPHFLHKNLFKLQPGAIHPYPHYR